MYSAAAHPFQARRETTFDNTTAAGLPELVQNRRAPETTVNEQVRGLEAFAGLGGILDRDLATPPGSPVDGARYLVATSPTGTWTGRARAGTSRAIKTQLGSSTTLSRGCSWVADENILIRYDGSAWAEFAPNPQPPAVSTQSGTSYTAVSGDANAYIRFTSASAVLPSRPMLPLRSPSTQRSTAFRRVLGRLRSLPILA